MAMFGIIEILIMFLGVGGFTVQPNPNAPSVKEIIHYAPSGADVMVYGDVASAAPAAASFLSSVPAHPIVASIPELSRGLGRTRDELEQVRAESRSRLGFDPVTDIEWVAGWMKWSPNDKEPEFLLVVHGKLDPGPAMGLIGGSGGANNTETVDGRPLLRMGRDVAFGVGKDGSWLIGTPAWVEARARDRWRGTKPSATDKEVLAGKPALALLSTPGPRLVAAAEKEFDRDDEQFGRSLVTGHERFGVTMTHDSVRVLFTARDAEGFELARLGADGATMLARAGHPATRGAARMGLVVLSSFANKQPEIAQFLQHKDAVLKLVDQWTGDGTFKLQRKDDKRSRTVRVTARASHVSQVIPMIGVVGLGWAGIGLRDF